MEVEIVSTTTVTGRIYDTSGTVLTNLSQTFSTDITGGVAIRGSAPLHGLHRDLLSLAVGTAAQADADRLLAAGARIAYGAAQPPDPAS